MQQLAQAAQSAETVPFFQHARLRSDGILSADQRIANDSLAYDPLQMGWVPVDVIDDLSRHGTPQPSNLSDASTLRPVPCDIHLRAWSKADAARYQELLDDPLIWAQMPEDYPDPLTRDLAGALIDIANSSNHHRVFAVLQGSVPVGQVRIAFSESSAVTHEAEISYWIGRDFWGQGLGSAAVTTFAEQCLRDHPDLIALVARVKDGNPGSRRVLEKAGFTLIGHDSVPGWVRLKKPRD